MDYFVVCFSANAICQFFCVQKLFILLCSIRIISGVTSESAIYLTLIKYNIEILITVNI